MQRQADSKGRTIVHLARDRVVAYRTGTGQVRGSCLAVAASAW